MNCESTTQAMLESQYPALTRLRLGQEDLIALSQQGIISPERMRGPIRHKLRFRRSGRQVVRYIRPTDIDRVRAELSELQAARRLNKELSQLNRLARQVLRDSKTQLQPLINELGFRFHGREIRRPRQLRKSVIGIQL
jgi:hypothetical protein